MRHTSNLKALPVDGGTADEPGREQPPDPQRVLPPRTAREAATDKLFLNKK